MTLQYDEVITRTLSPAERRVAIQEHETPLVIEPLESRSFPFLQEFLKRNSSQLLEDIAAHGALLLRGFDVISPLMFEQIVLSIRGMQGMNEVLLSEAGRTITQGTRFVFHTNTLAKTGGAFDFGNFHTENYGVPDIPRYISFFCQEPSRLGGETGLLNTAKVYADVPDSLKYRLEERTCLVTSYSITEMEKRYGLSGEIIKKFCERAGLPVFMTRGHWRVAIYKPSVIQHPVTHERALLISYFFVPGLQKALLQTFSRDYLGSEWLLHKLIWKGPWWLPRIGEPQFLVNALRARQRLRGEHAADAPLGATGSRSLGSLFSQEESQRLAKIIRHRFSSFLWRKGDILIVDNLKMAHSGMAGRGNRELKVMICNPVLFPSSPTNSGLHVVPYSNDPQECLGTKLVRLRARGASMALKQLDP